MIIRWLLIVLGFIFVGFAILGVLLPGLPAFPFLVLATACFSRSSEKFHRWLLSNRLLGPIITNWQTTRSMPRKAKIMAISSIILGGGYSVLFMLDNFIYKLIMVGLLMIPIVIISRLPTSEDLCLARAEEK